MNTNHTEDEPSGSYLASLIADHPPVSAHVLAKAVKESQDEVLEVTKSTMVELAGLMAKQGNEAIAPVRAGVAAVERRVDTVEVKVDVTAKALRDELNALRDVLPSTSLKRLSDLASSLEDAERSRVQLALHALDQSLMSTLTARSVTA